MPIALHDLLPRAPAPSYQSVDDAAAQAGYTITREASVTLVELVDELTGDGTYALPESGQRQGDVIWVSRKGGGDFNWTRSGGAVDEELTTADQNIRYTWTGAAWTYQIFAGLPSGQTATNGGTFDPADIDLSAGLVEYDAYTQTGTITLGLDELRTPGLGGEVSVNITGSGDALNFSSPFVGVDGLVSGTVLQSGISYPVKIRFAPDWEEVSEDTFEDRYLVEVIGLPSPLSADLNLRGHGIYGGDWVVREADGTSVTLLFDPETEGQDDRGKIVRCTNSSGTPVVVTIPDDALTGPVRVHNATTGGLSIAWSANVSINKAAPASGSLAVASDGYALIDVTEIVSTFPVATISGDVDAPILLPAAIDFNGNTLNRCAVRQAADLATSGASDTLTLDYSTGDVFKVTIAHATPTIAVSNLPSDCTGILIRLVNGGSQTITWPTMEWPGGQAPSNLTASGTDVLAILKDDDAVLTGVVLALDVS